MELPLSHHRRMSVDEFDTRIVLAHAAKQARERGYQNFPIIDVDSHHFETEHFSEIVKYIDDPVIRQLLEASSIAGYRGVGALPAGLGYQDYGGRIMREPLRKLERTEPQPHRDVTLTRRWMDSMGVDIAILFPTPMLHLGLHPQVEIEVALSNAYNRWLVEHVLADEPRIRSMLYLPFNDPAATYRVVKEFTGKPGVVGFMVTSNRYRPVHHNDYMKTYALLEEANLPLAFHGAYNWNDQSLLMVNRFISAHALGFVWHNLVHLTNWVINGIPERFPKLKVLWIESGLAWLPFIMQRLDNEYMMRTADAPELKRLPSEYIRDMYYTNQPMEKTGDMALLETTFRVIKAETQLLYSSDYPHWDFDLPSVIYDLPFLNEAQKRQILGGNALRIFGMEAPKTKLAVMD
ncbi:MAG: amidohydrolase family protein [Xanthobacteraceae bacterium]|nr:amidohydrolase family protein [Xanthobacteraceae bacterium]